jgi:integrase
VPLTAPVLDMLRRRRFGADERFVFSNHRHTCVSARAKKAASTLSKGLSFEFRAHDLRRTAASFMGEAGVDRSILPIQATTARSFRWPLLLAARN